MRTLVYWYDGNQMQATIFPDTKDLQADHTAATVELIKQRLLRQSNPDEPTIECEVSLVVVIPDEPVKMIGQFGSSEYTEHDA